MSGRDVRVRVRVGVAVVRLRQRGEFVAAARGARQSCEAFGLQGLRRPERGNAIGLGLTVTRKIGGAVVRNRARRRLREALRLTLPGPAKAGADYVVVARPAALTCPSRSCGMISPVPSSCWGGASSVVEDESGALALIGLVNAYRWLISPILGTNCRYSPSCSEYAIEALRRHGAARGTGLALRRVVRCHPWGGHGYDPVPPDTGGR